MEDISPTRKQHGRSRQPATELPDDNENSPHNGEFSSAGRLPPVKPLHPVSDTTQPVVTMIPAKKNKIGTTTLHSPDDGINKVGGEEQGDQKNEQNGPKVGEVKFYATKCLLKLFNILRQQKILMQCVNLP